MAASDEFRKTVDKMRKETTDEALSSIDRTADAKPEREKRRTRIIQAKINENRVRRCDERREEQDCPWSELTKKLIGRRQKLDDLIQNIKTGK